MFTFVSFYFKIYYFVVKIFKKKNELDSNSIEFPHRDKN